MSQPKFGECKTIEEIYKELERSSDNPGRLLHLLTGCFKKNCSLNKINIKRNN